MQTVMSDCDVYALCLTHTHAFTHSYSSTLAGFAIVHQPVSSVTGALDQSSDHLTLLGAASVILVTVALAGARTCTHRTETSQEHKHSLLSQDKYNHTLHKVSAGC